MDKALELDPEFCDAYTKKGMAYYYLNNVEEALNNFDRAKEYGEVDTNYYTYQGKTKILLDDYSGALNDLNKVIEIDPEFTEAYYGRAETKIYLPARKLDNYRVFDLSAEYRQVRKRQRRAFLNDKVGQGLRSFESR